MMTSGDVVSYNQLGVWESVAHLIVTTEKSGWPKVVSSYFQTAAVP